jgi:hypothetical protein
VLRSPSKMAKQCCGSGFIEYRTDPDPAFQVNPDPIRIQGFDDQKLKKTIQLKFFISFKSKIAIYLSLGIQPSKENIQHFKT